MIVALLSFYDERPGWLFDCVESLGPLEVSHVVAVDGAYALFPGGAAASSPDGHEALHDACAAIGASLTLEVPARVWAGNEVEKRTRLFELGDATRCGWQLVVDADERCLTVPDGLHGRLDATDLDVAYATYWEHQADGRLTEFRRRCLFRARLGLRPRVNHHTYVTSDGRRLWGQAPLAPALDLTGLEWSHLTNLRDGVRRDRALEYYRARDLTGVEVPPCDVCGGRAVKELPANWREKEPGVLTSDWVAVCADHEPRVRDRSRELLEAVGLDASVAQVQFRHQDAVA